VRNFDCLPFTPLWSPLRSFRSSSTRFFICTRSFTCVLYMDFFFRICKWTAYLCHVQLDHDLFQFRRIKWEIKPQTFLPLIYLRKLSAQFCDPIVTVTLIYEMLELVCFCVLWTVMMLQSSFPT
jgi:hypothetical protein